MALKMRDDRNGRNNKRRKDSSGRPQTDQQDANEHHVNGDWNDGLTTCAGPEAPSNHDHKRMAHNEVEKRRKDRIKQGISTLGQLLPPMTPAEKQANCYSAERNTLSILERTANFIRDLKEKHEKFLMDKGEEVQAEEIKRLKAELEETRMERDKFENQLRAAGIPLMDDFPSSWTFRKYDMTQSASDGGQDSVVLALPSDQNMAETLSSNNSFGSKGDESTKSKKGSKHRRKNTISSQLENSEKANSGDDQGLKTGDVLMTAQDQGMFSQANMGMMGLGQNSALNPQFLNASVLGGNVQQGQGQLLLPALNIVNPAAINAGAINPAAINQGAINPATLNPALMQNFGMDRCNGIMPYMSPNTNISALTQNNNAADGFSLLQMAMRDAGITATSMSTSAAPQSAQSVSGSNTSITSAQSSKSAGISELATSDTSSSPLHTLASVAADTQSSSSNIVASSSTVAGISQTQTLTSSTASTSTTQAINLNMPIMTPGQCGLMQTFNPNMGLQVMAQNQGMPFSMMQNGGLGGISVMSQQQGQILYLNEQGIPVLSNMPMHGFDGSAMTNSSQIACVAQPNSVTGLKPGSATGMSQMQVAQKGQNVLSQMPDSQPSAEIQARDGMVQFQNNILQQQSQLQPGDTSNQQQGQAPKIGFNPLQNQPGVNVFPNAGDSANALLQVQQQQQQQLNQQLIQAAQLSGLNTGMNRTGAGINQTAMNVMGSCGKAENPNNTTALTGENLMLPVSQSGNLLTLNHGQNPVQLPSALILPNGQIIPVVTQPQLLMGQNQQPAVSAVNTSTNALQQSMTINKPADGANPALQGVGAANNTIPQVQEVCSVSSSQVATTRQTGLLMTTNTIVTAPNRPVSTSVAALTTTVVPTTVTGSVMTTQVQKHQTMTTQGQKRQSSNKTESKNDGSQNLQPKMTIPTNVSVPESARNSSVMQSSAAQMPMGIDPHNTQSGSNPVTILPSGQFVNNSGAIVLTLPTNCPGQPPTSVLVDPNTMQVLGMLPQQQPTQQQSTLPVPSVPTGQQTQANVQPAAEHGKKSKKGLHRALKPKPPTTKEKSAKSQSSMSTSTSISVTSTTTTSTGQANNEPTSPRSNQGTNSASATDISATDILAQAAESIFSDISPSITNFYNPANEDNPLHIDTSAGDTEEDAVAVSPKKDRLQNSQAIYNKQSSILHHDVTDPSTSPYHFVESPPLSKEVLKKSKSKKSSGSVASQKSVAAKKPSKKPSGGSKNSKKSQQNKEKGDNPSKQTDSAVSGKQNDDKSSEKQKSGVEAKNVVDAHPKIPDPANNLKRTDPGKDDVSQLVQTHEQVHPTSEYQQLFSDESSHGEFGQQDTPSVGIPETISFTENELSDVLDQVEKLGNSLTEENQTPASAKKSKSRKNKGQSETGCEEHSSKKKKKSSHDEPDLTNTSLSMDSILASISSGTTNANPKDETSKKKESESSETLSIHVDQPTLHMPTLSSPTRSIKSISPSTSKKNKPGSELSGVSSAVDTNVKRAAHMDNLTNPLHIVSSPPQSSPAMMDLTKSMGSSSTSPSLTSPPLNVNSIHGSSGQKTNNMGHAPENRLLSNEGNMNEFSFFMPDSADSQVPQGPQSVPCMPTSGVSIPTNGSSHSQSPGNRGTTTASCKLPSEQQRLSNSSSLPNVQSSMMSPRSVCSSSSPMESSVHHGPQSLPSSINNQLTYSAESLFSPSSNCQLNALPDIRRELNQASNPPAPPLMHPSSQVTVQPANTSPGVSRPRTSIYSAENFVQPSMNCDSQNVPKSSYNRPQEDYPQTASSRANPMAMAAESFNFSNIASNVPNNNRGRTSSNVNTTMTPTSSSSFSFSLTGNAESTNNSFPPQIGHHQFPFYPLHPSVTTSQGANPESTPETSRKSGQLDHQPVGFPSFGSDPRSTTFPSTQLNPEQSPLNHMGPVPQPFSGFPTPPESTGTAHSDDGMFHNRPPLGGSSSGNKVDSRSVSGTSNVRKHKDPGHSRPGMSGTEQQDGRSMERSFVSTGLPSFYTPIRQQTNAPPPLETPPLHHLPPSSNDTRMSNSYQPSMSNSSHQFNSDFSSVRMEGPSVQMPNGGNQNYSQHQQNNPSTDANKHNRQKAKQLPDPHLSRRQGIISMDPQVPTRGSSSRQPPQNQHDHRSSQNPGSHTPTPNSHIEQQQAPTSQQARSQKGSTKQSKGQPTRSKKSSKQSFNQDMDSGVTHSLFDASQGIPPFFPIASLSPPPSRSAQPDGPTYMPHLFGPSSRSLPNANIGVHKNPGELGGTFNQLFNPVRTQTSLGLNFQPGFGMNPVHGGHGSAAQIKSHSTGVSVTQPMSNFNLTNIFPDVNNCSQSNGGLNISPIKFPHGNAIIPPQPGMDPNTLQHHHQPGMLYHNRTPGPPPVLHNAMSINSLIGHNHPGMGQINNTMGQTFHGYGHPSSFTMPHLNFMHEH
ncbi:serine-rich adhesin for platelets-like [Liolophura sinensis]|uniref:serine-rich adhesin for platelets-like n=1 Tax=Liolophura sinensis TaxID=3198878 RepID=UPI0031593E8A